MEVYATLTQKVEIDPKEVIKKLIANNIGENSWVFERDDKFYKGFERSAGSHSLDDEEEISSEQYDYIKALELVLNKLITRRA